MEPEWTDAKFKVIRQPKRRWRVWIDWRVVLIVAAVAASALRLHSPS